MLLIGKRGRNGWDIPGKNSQNHKTETTWQTMEEQILMFDPVYRQIRFETDEAGGL